MAEEKCKSDRTFDRTKLSDLYEMLLRGGIDALANGISSVAMGLSATQVDDYVDQELARLAQRLHSFESHLLAPHQSVGFFIDSRLRSAIARVMSEGRSSQQVGGPSRRP